MRGADPSAQYHSRGADPSAQYHSQRPASDHAKSALETRPALLLEVARSRDSEEASDEAKAERAVRAREARDAITRAARDGLRVATDAAQSSAPYVSGIAKGAGDAAASVRTFIGRQWDIRRSTPSASEQNRPRSVHGESGEHARHPDRDRKGMARHNAGTDAGGRSVLTGGKHRNLASNSSKPTDGSSSPSAGSGVTGWWIQWRGRQ